MNNLEILRNGKTVSVSLLIHSYHHPFKFTLCTNKLSIPKLIFALLQFLNFYASVPLLYPHLRNLKNLLHASQRRISRFNHYAACCAFLLEWLRQKLRRRNPEGVQKETLPPPPPPTVRFSLPFR